MFDTFPKIGLIGSNGYWGPQIRRVLGDLDCLIFPCDLKGDSVCKDYHQFTSLKYEAISGAVVNSCIDAAIIATPPETHFEISLPEAGNVTIKIFNTKGQLVNTLFDKINMVPGTHNILWNGKDVPSGTYFYQVVTDKFSDVKKMTLLK